MIGRIVVGIDGSVNSHRSLAWAVAEARLRGSTVHAIHSWTFPEAMADPKGGIAHADFQAAAQKVLEEALGSLSDEPDVEIRCEVSNDSPAEALVSASADAELIVIGSRGLGGFRGLLLGGVSQQVASHAKCPVVIIPHEESD